MGRIAGVSSAETRERLLSAAAATFASEGYEGTRVADIAGSAGLSNGAMYGHFASKAELLVEALRVHGSQRLAELFAADPDRSVVDLLVGVGRHLLDTDHLRDVERHPGALVVEALVAARRDGEVADLMRDHLHESEDWMVQVVRCAQDEGSMDRDVPPEVFSRFCLMVLLGSLLLPAVDLPPVDAQEWSDFMTRLGTSLRPG